MLWVALHFPRLPAQALAPIAAWACQFTPKVSLEPPQELLLEVQGSLRLFGGFASLRQKLAAGLGQLGFGFNLAAAETDLQDVWQTAEIGLVTISTDAGLVQSLLEKSVRWIERHAPDVEVVDYQIEMR